MRVNNAITIGFAAYRPTQIAKRAALLALLVASGSTASGQGRADDLANSRFANTTPAPRIVRNNANRVADISLGVVRSNPFFVTTKQQQTPVDQTPLPLTASQTATPVVSRTQNSLDHYLVQDNLVPTKMAADHVASSRPQPLPTGPESATPLVPISKPNLASMKAKQSASPIGVMDNVASRVVPVVDARDDQAIVNETQPISFSLSDDAAKKAKSSSNEAKPETDKMPLTTVESPVKLAPMINFNKPAVTSSQLETVKQPTVRINPLLTEFGGNLVKKDNTRRRMIDQKTSVTPNINDIPQVDVAKVSTNKKLAKDDVPVTDDYQAVIDSLPTVPAQSLQTAISVALLPVAIARTDVADGSPNPAINAVTYDPSLMPMVNELTESEAVNPDQATANTIAPSVIPKSTILSHRNSTGTTTILASSKRNVENTAIPIQAKRDESMVLHLSRAQVRSLTIGGELRRVSIADKDICQAFESGANQVKLIGTGLGKTTLTVWADVVPGEPTRRKTFTIKVAEGVNATGDKVSEHTVILNESIDRTFPRASVVVSRRGGELHVTGHCDTEADAKQIIRMVRKSCLVPVQDNLKVR